MMRWNKVMVIVLVCMMVLMAMPRKAQARTQDSWGFETGTLAGWSVVSEADHVGVTPADGIETPYWGSYMAILGQPRESGPQGGAEKLTARSAGLSTTVQHRPQPLVDGYQPAGPNTIRREFTANMRHFVFAYNVFSYGQLRNNVGLANRTLDYGYGHFSYLISSLDGSIVIASGLTPISGQDSAATGWQLVEVDLSDYLYQQLVIEVSLEPAARVVSSLVSGKDALISKGYYSYSGSWAYVDVDDEMPIVPVILASAGPNGSISPSGSVFVDRGSDKTFAITPNVGYHVLDVLVDGSTVGAVASYTFTNVTTNHTIEATFAINMYDITVVAGLHGTVTPGTGSFPYHATQAYVVKPDPGHLIDKLTIDGVVIKEASNKLGYSMTFTDIESDHMIAATFKAVLDVQLPIITLPKFGAFAGVRGWVDGLVQTFYVRTSPFPLQFTLEDNGGWVKWTITVNGIVIVDPVGIGLINYALPLTEGRNDVEITGVDGASNWASRRVVIYLDSVAPGLLVSTLPPTISTPTLFVTGSATDAVSGLASLSINGEHTTPFLDGSFSAKLTLVKGVNTILVEAMDKAGNTTTQSFTVTYGAPSGAPSSTYVVLTIGSMDMEVNGLTRKLDAAPFIKDGRTLLPIRALIEALGGSVNWNGTTKTATVTLGSRTVALTIGSTTALVNGTPITLDVAPEIRNGRTFLPLRAVAENLGLDLAWEPISRTISLTYWP
jgi:hypothetical protein